MTLEPVKTPGRRITDRLRRRSMLQAHLFIGLVGVSGLLATVASITLYGASVEGESLTLLLLSIGVLVGELFPLRVRRPGAEGEVTPSTTFAFGMVLVAGYSAVPFVVLACAVSDVITRKSAPKVFFNAGQYALTVAGAAAILTLFSGVPHEGAPVPFLPGDLPVILVAGAVWFSVNSLLVAMVIALLEQQPLVRMLRDDLLFQATSAGLLLGLAPMVVLSTEYTPFLLPLFVLPLLSIVQGQRQALQKEHEALHDPLTRLPNRVLFKQRVAWAIRAAAVDQEKAAVMLVDLDGFKQINDTLGHQEGDRLLIALSDRLSRRMRSSDVVARLGGDEFGVLVAGVTREQARGVARDLHALLCEPVAFDDVEIALGASIGIAMHPDHGAGVDDLILHADMAMYRAKRARTGVEFYDPEETATVSRSMLATDMERGLGSGEILPFFQPQVDAATGRVTGAEALVRWRHPERGLMLPADFLPIAEQSGLIARLTDVMLEAALRQRMAWAAAGHELTVAVNLSGRSLLDLRLPERVAGVLERTGAPASALGLEVTESLLMADPRRTVPSLEALRASGVSMAIDDFGTGHSSLERLRRLPVDVVKIDRSFVLGMSRDEADALIVRTTIDLSRHLGLSVVAEGVEDAEVQARLTAMGCDTIQGFHVGRPMDAAAFVGWLAARPAQPLAA